MAEIIAVSIYCKLRTYSYIASQIFSFSVPSYCCTQQVSTDSAMLLVISHLIFAWLFSCGFLHTYQLLTFASFYTFLHIITCFHAGESWPFYCLIESRALRIFTQDPFCLWSFYSNILWPRKCVCLFKSHSLNSTFIHSLNLSNPFHIVNVWSLHARSPLKVHAWSSGWVPWWVFNFSARCLSKAWCRPLFKLFRS
jgi:hypothetical protein